jgi:mannose-6-phosphate isomerase-like protein (cupin superfamily)
VCPFARSLTGPAFEFKHSRCRRPVDRDVRAREPGAMSDPVFSLTRFPVHLGGGARIVRLPAHDGTTEWYQRYGEQHGADGDDGRLVSMYTFDDSWSTWEMHPHGEELVVCVAGTITLHQEIEGDTTTVTLAAGDAVVNPPGAWHTADVDAPCTAVFITSGRGTEIRPR